MQRTGFTSQFQFTLRTKVLIASACLILTLIGVILYIVVKLEKSADEVVESSKLITESAANQLKIAVIPTVDSILATSLLSDSTQTRLQMKHIDSLFASVTSSALSSFDGMEGGYYFPGIDEFLGYSFPTSPPPKPEFGPPPRSYVIIRQQAIQSIKENKRITHVHQFDPARFPLVTEPIEINGTIVGSVWARVHIERLIPTFSLIDILVGVASLFLAGFATVLLISWNMRKRVEEVRLGLRSLHTDGNFRFTGKQGVFGEITHSINEMIEARAVEQERREKLERDLHQQDKMITLGTLIAGVAHEVKTPLAVIKTRIQMWDRKLRHLENNNENGNVVTPDSMELVIREIDRLSDLVKRLLFFSKPVANKLRATDVNQLLTHTLSLIQTEAEQRKLTIHQQLDETLVQVPLDPQAMEQVFLNIMTNSVEAMHEGGKLSIRAYHIPGEENVIVEIEDTGTGIPPEALNKIFNPFFTTKESGVGLGLSISYEIVHAHKGKIEFPKSDCQGTLCRITLPLHSH